MSGEAVITIVLVGVGLLSWYLSRLQRGEHLDSKARHLGYLSADDFIQDWSRFLMRQNWVPSSAHETNAWLLRTPYSDTRRTVRSRRDGIWVLILKPDSFDDTYSLDLVIVVDNSIGVWRGVGELRLGSLVHQSKSRGLDDSRFREHLLAQFARTLNLIRFGEENGESSCDHNWRQVDSEMLMRCRECGTLHQGNPRFFQLKA